MNRLAAIGITVVLAWALVPGVGEFVENAMHFVQEGHFAHAAPNGDQHQPSGPEHGCTSTLHLCSCCVSLSCVPIQHRGQIPDLASRELAARAEGHLFETEPGSVYRPPRA